MLKPHVVAVVGNAATVNLFQVPGGYALPVTFGGKAANARVVLHGLDGIDEKTVCEALHPGRQQAVAVPLSRSGADTVLEVPLVRGSAMVKISR